MLLNRDGIGYLRETDGNVYRIHDGMLMDVQPDGTLTEHIDFFEAGNEIEM